jgi:predicted nucleic acid-binding protein
MLGEIVADASVVAKVFLDEEDGAEAAAALVFSGTPLIAPDFVLAELANVAVTKVRRGTIQRAIGERMAQTVVEFFEALIPARELSARAFELAVDHGMSAYDALYVALAETRGCPLVSADARLLAKISAARLAIEARAL